MSSVSDTTYDICIVGAGVAGAAMAAFLGKKGKKVALIERHLGERNVIVGELLQPGGVQYLRKLGLENVLDNLDAQPVYGYNILFEGKNCLIPYPKTKGQDHGFGFRNGKFLQNIRHECLHQSTLDVFEGKVTCLNRNDERYTGVNFIPKGSDGELTINAIITVVSDGPLSQFRDQLSIPKLSISSYFLGLMLEDAALPQDNYGHLVMGNHPPFVLYPVNSKDIRILIDFPGDRPPKMNGELKDQLIAQFHEAMPLELRAAFLEAVDKGRFKVMPNHRLPAKPKLENGAVLLGDSLNMRHPLTGGGMTVAFADVLNLGTRLADIEDFNETSKVDAAITSFYETRHLGSQTINILADGLYNVVTNAGLRQAFFGYIGKGGKYAEEPMALLGSLSLDKNLLIRHFFGVANYGSRAGISEKKGIAKITTGYQLLKDAIHIIRPLLKSEQKQRPVRSN